VGSQQTVLVEQVGVEYIHYCWKAVRQYLCHNLVGILVREQMKQWIGSQEGQRNDHFGSEELIGVVGD